MTNSPLAPAADPVPGAGSRRIQDVLAAQQAQLQLLFARLTTAKPDDVHQARVAARRIRSLLKTFGPLFDARWAHLYRIDLRSFARALATVREADVISDVVQRTVRSGAMLKPPEMGRLTASLQHLRADVRDRLQRQVSEPGWRALTAALSARTVHSPSLARSDVSLGEVLELADRAWRRGRRRLRHHPEAAPELHELRLTLKHCRYALEAIEDVKPRTTARLLRRLRRAQEKIGAHRDTIAAAHWVRSHERTLGRGAMTRIEAALIERESRQRDDAAGESEKVLRAYVKWRDAIRPLRKAARSGRA